MRFMCERLPPPLLHHRLVPPSLLSPQHLVPSSMLSKCLLETATKIVGAETLLYQESDGKGTRNITVQPRVRRAPFLRRAVPEPGTGLPRETRQL